MKIYWSTITKIDELNKQTDGQTTKILSVSGGS